MFHSRARQLHLSTLCVKHKQTNPKLRIIHSKPAFVILTINNITIWQFHILWGVGFTTQLYLTIHKNCQLLFYCIKLPLTLTITYDNIMNCYYVTLPMIHRGVISHIRFCNDVFRMLSRAIME